MHTRELLKEKRDDILRAAALHGASNVRIFGSAAGSAASDSAGPESDIDLLVDLAQGRSLFDLGGLLMDLQDILGCRVDLVTEGALHWYIRDRVLREAVPL